MPATLDSRTHGQIPRDLMTFATLPSEVRDMIWEEVCKFSNIIEGYLADHTEESHDALTKIPYIIHYKVPSVLHVCAQSRHVALQRYRLLAGNPSNDQKLYINYHNDIMLYPDWFSISLLGCRRDQPFSILHPDPLDIFQVDWQSVIVRQPNSAPYRGVARGCLFPCRPFLPAVKRVVMERNGHDAGEYANLTNLFNGSFINSGVSVKPTFDLWMLNEINEWLSGVALVGI